MTEFKIKKTKAILDRLQKKMFNVTSKTINIVCDNECCGECTFANLVGFGCRCAVFGEDTPWRNDYEGDNKKWRCDGCLNYEEKLKNKEKK
jgi:hypothetical protein